MILRHYKRPRGYQFDGEPRLMLGDNGVTIEVRGGHPVMDAGLENAALISLFTRRGWFGNTFMDGEYQVGDSDFADISSGAVTKSTFVQAENEAERALKWMVDDGLSSEIEASISNRAGTGIDFIVKIHAPEGTLEEIKLRRYGLNWVRQMDDPASSRLTSEGN